MDHLADLECPNTMLRNHPGFLQFKESSPMLYSNEAFFLPQPSSSMEGCHSDFILPFCRDPASLLHLSTTINNHATGTAASFAANYSIGPSEKGLLDDNEATLKKRKLDKSKEVRRSNAKQVGNHKGVVRVRARRGQATDSHSLAERVRRQKISEKMRCLQGLVPGCYKEMGIAAMLGEIINYVQSLQNQVEFLSMKLSVASNFHNFNMDMGAQVPPLEPQEDYGCDGQVHRKMRPREECTSLNPSTMHF